MQCEEEIKNIVNILKEKGNTNEDIAIMIKKAADKATAGKTTNDLNAIQQTQIYLDNYRELKRYITSAVSEASQIKSNVYNISAEKAFLQTIRECRTETIILYEHINRALESLREDTKISGEEYKFHALEQVYVNGKHYEDVVKEMNCGKNAPKRWCEKMIERLAIKIFGAKAL